MNRKTLLNIPALAADRKGSKIRIILTYNIKLKMARFITAGKRCLFKKPAFGGVVSCVGVDPDTITLVFALQALGLDNERR